MRIASPSITEIDHMNRIKRLILMFQIYALDITIAGQTETLACIGDPVLQFRIEIARSIARRERTRLRSALNSLLPVGHR